MAKISKYNVLWLVLECRVLFGLGETGILKLTLCKHPEQGHTTASCPSDKVLRLEKITSGGFACQDYNNRDMCHSNINTFFKNNCLQKQNCTLPTTILPDSNCQRQPRRLEVEFECSLLFSFKYTVQTCANSLAEVHCHLWHYIEIKKVKSISDEICCQSNVSSSAKDSLMSLCDGKHKCWPDTTKHLSLFHERVAIVSYLCKEQTDPLVTESIQSTSSDPKLDMTTISIADATVEQDTLPELKFDKDHRIEINHHSLNQTLYLCGLGWDDFDAGVLCKSIDRTWIGKSIVVDNMQDLTVAPYSLQCGGLEKSLFECNYTTDVKGCNIAKVAGAICCEDTDNSRKCVMNPSSNKVSSESSTIGVAVGIPIAVIAVVCIIVLVLFTRRRRNMHKNPDKKSDDNYLGHQDIALPQHTTSDGIMYTQANNTNTQGIEGGQEYSHQLEDTQSPYALSEDGVYDKANEKRHIVNDTAVYSRAIDTMYDSTDQHNRQERKEGTYDHVFSQKTEDQYDITTRK